MAFSLFFFMALALLKRVTELRRAPQQPGPGECGRGYGSADCIVMAGLAATSGYLSVLLFALYINSPEVHVLYSRPMFLWPICVLILYWITRMVLIANRGHLPDDPIVFAFRDRASIGAGIVALAALWAAS
jgi:hypothetical protein